MPEVRGSALKYLALPRTGAGLPILIIHSWWGLTDSFISFADQLAARGFVAGCVDLFQGATATTELEARRLRAVRRSEPTYRTLQQSLVELAAHPRSNGTDPATIGFSMGGHWAIWLAQHPPPQVSATVLYYAARAGDFSRATTPILGHFAAHDDYVSVSARKNMERAVASRGLAYAANDYPATSHWFAESDHAAFDPDAADLAFNRTLDFLKGVRGGDRR